MGNKIIDYPGALCNFVYYGILDLGYFSHFLWGFVGIAVTTALCYLTYDNYIKSIKQADCRKTNPFFSSSAFFLLLISLGILLLRLPVFCASELNVDESEWISGAATLIRDFRFWKSVNGTTSGPLNIFPLCLISLAGAGLNYATVRLFSVLFIILPAIFIAYKLFKTIFGGLIARIISVALFFFFAFSENFDIVSYNSEHVPMLLTILAFYFLVRAHEKSMNNKKNNLSLFLCGLITGLLPYSKYQAIPIAFTLCIIALTSNFFRKQNFTGKNLFLLLGLVVPTALLFVYLYLFDLKEEFLHYYIFNNNEYGIKGLLNSSRNWWDMQNYQSTDNWLEKLLIVHRLISMSKDTVLYFSVMAVMSIFGFIVIVKNFKSISEKNIEFVAFSFAVFLSVYYAIIKPGNAFLHYIILMIIPSVLLSGFLLCTALDVLKNNHDKIKFFLKIYLVIFYFIPVAIFALDGNCFIKGVLNRDSARQISKVSEIIKKYSSPNDRMVVWGYSNILYIESEMLQGAREPFAYLQITESPSKNYFIGKFCEDVETNKPEIFVDAIEKNSFFCEEYQKYEYCPLVRKIINEHYEFKDSTGGVRIFVLKK